MPSGCDYLSFNVMIYYITLERLTKLNKKAHKKSTLDIGWSKTNHKIDKIKNNIQYSLELNYRVKLI